MNNRVYIEVDEGKRNHFDFGLCFSTHSESAQLVLLRCGIVTNSFRWTGGMGDRERRETEIEGIERVPARERERI